MMKDRTLVLLEEHHHLLSPSPRSIHVATHTPNIVSVSSPYFLLLALFLMQKLQKGGHIRIGIVRLECQVNFSLTLPSIPGK